MKTVKNEAIAVPPKILTWVWDTVAEISDEVGTEKKGNYLLAYEGWGSICVSCEADPQKTDEENEAAYYKYAEEQSNEVIKEWLKTYKRTHQLIDSGYEPTGLYGVTWALFKKSKKGLKNWQKISRNFERTKTRKKKCCIFNVL